MGTAGTSDAQMVDGQALLEVTASCLMALLVRAGLVHDIGLLGSATVVMPEMILATDEIVGMLQHLLAGVSSDKSALATDVIGDVGPGGTFLTHPHTLKHFREVCYASLFYRGGARQWVPDEFLPFEDRVRAATRQLMSTHEPQPLPDETFAAMEQVLLRAEREVIQ